LCCIALALFCLPARAGESAVPTEMVIRLTVRPAAAPRPALRYLLLPELKEMSPGNPIQGYLKATLDQDLSAPREVFPPSALRQVDRAARLDKPDWQILPKLRTDGFGLLLPDLQKMRGLAGALQVRFRAENAKGQFDDSLRTAKTLFAMSRHMGEHPTLIGELVGIAIAFVAVGPLEEMLQMPGCPNLYWALTNLPRPLVPLDKGLEGERILIEAELRDLDDRNPMTARQLKKLLAHLDKLLSLERQPWKTVRAWLDARKKDEKAVPAARDRLAGAGFPRERLGRFPADQVLLLDAKLTYEVCRDDLMKHMKLAAWQVEAEAAKLGKPDKENLFGFLVPALVKVRRAQGRLGQRLALLRHVEALRLYAAAHAGRLPAKLSDCPVPLPDDPFTGKPFRYEVKGSVAHLRGSAPASAANVPAFNIHYQVTIQK
jgi:hypothetical protein